MQPIKTQKSQSSRTDTSYVSHGQNRKESPRGDDPLFMALTPGGDRRRVITVQNIRYWTMN